MVVGVLVFAPYVFEPFPVFVACRPLPLPDMALSDPY
jgi:hypothetical protein